MNICMVGYGMMGVWHSDALQDEGCTLHTVVGRREEATEVFAKRYGYRRWTVDLDEALADPEIDVVIVATPSETHAEYGIRSVEAGKHTLLEIPIAMTLEESERVAAAAEKSGVTFGLCHPMRLRSERGPMRDRIAAGEEAIRHIQGRFFIHRLSNVGATGYQRSWTDNILWHHFTHFLDLGLWLLDFQGELAYSFLGPVHEKTGIPMECILAVETQANQTLLVSGSYHARERVYDSLVITDRDSYRVDILNNRLYTGDGSVGILPEKDNLALVTKDFIAAVRDGREPAVTGRSVLPAMRILDAAQRRWDTQFGARSLPGRQL
ncbi:MAG: Gfo/Idh/MocA family oxidoreductase [Alphaproteobacteria bacterium]|nr:Gfo/Idh/MocA family oxidoreductase [Alphaproteobacteria bacterium]